jgi:hypothetical protein
LCDRRAATIFSGIGKARFLLKPDSYIQAKPVRSGNKTTNKTRSNQNKTINNSKKTVFSLRMHFLPLKEAV